MTEQTYYRWRKAYGGLRMDQAKRLKSLEKENGRLKKLVADLSVDNQILKEVSSGNFQARRSGEEPWYGCESGSDLSESPSVGPAACWDRPGPPSEESDRFPRKRDNWCSGWWSWPVSMAVYGRPREYKRFLRTVRSNVVRCSRVSGLLMRRVTRRGPVWRCADQVQIGRACLKALGHTLVFPIPSR